MPTFDAVYADARNDASAFGAATGASAATNVTAINAAIADSDTVILGDTAPGDYTINDAIELDRAGVTLILAEGAFLKLANGVDSIDGMISVTADNCTIKARTRRTAGLDGNRNNTTGIDLIAIAAGVSGTTIIGLDLSHSSEHGISDDGVGTKVIDCYSTDLAGSFHALNKSSAGDYAGPEAYDNEIDRSGEDGSAIIGGGFIWHGDDDTGAWLIAPKLVRNIIKMPRGQTADVAHGIAGELFACKGAIITDNDVDGGSEGLVLAAKSTGGLIANNRLKAQMFIPIEVDEGIAGEPQNVVEGNTIDATDYDVTDEGGAAIAINNGARASVSNNSIASLLRGILFSTDAGGPCGNNRIEIDGDGSAIHCQGAKSPLIGHNEYKQLSAGDGAAITIENCTGFLTVQGGIADSFGVRCEVIDNTGATIIGHIELPSGIDCTHPFLSDLSGGSVLSTTSFAVLQRSNHFEIIKASGAAASHTGDTTETALAQITIPSNRIGSNGFIRVYVQFSMTMNSNNKFFRVRLGGASGTVMWAAQPSTGISSQMATVLISNANATNSQIAAPSTSNGNGGNNGATKMTAAVDTTADTEIYISGQLTSAGDTVTLERFFVEALYQP